MAKIIINGKEYKQTSLYLRSDLYELVKKAKINVTKFVNEKLAEEIAKRGLKVPEFNADLVVRVRCPYCGAQRNSITLRLVTCFRCGHRFKVLCKRKFSRIVGIVKGSMAELHRRASLLLRS